MALNLLASLDVGVLVGPHFRLVLSNSDAERRETARSPRGTKWRDRREERVRRSNSPQSVTISGERGSCLLETRENKATPPHDFTCTVEDTCHRRYSHILLRQSSSRLPGLPLHPFGKPSAIKARGDEEGKGSGQGQHTICAEGQSGQTSPRRREPRTRPALCMSAIEK